MPEFVRIARSTVLIKDFLPITFGQKSIRSNDQPRWFQKYALKTD